MVAGVKVDASRIRRRVWMEGKVAWRDCWVRDSLVGLRPWRMMLKPREASSWAKPGGELVWGEGGMRRLSIPRPMPSLAPVIRAHDFLDWACDSVDS